MRMEKYKNGNGNLTMDIPQFGYSCPLFPDRIGIWTVGCLLKRLIFLWISIVTSVLAAAARVIQDH